MQQSQAFNGDAWVRALEETGLRARVETMDGQPRVVAPILDVDASQVASARNPEVQGYAQEAGKQLEGTYLFIATEGQSFPLQVGIIGYNQDTLQSFRGEDWRTAASLEELVREFRALWDARDSYVGLFTGQVGRDQSE